MPSEEDSYRERINALEDACLGVALIIDQKSGDPPARTEAPEPGPFTTIIQHVLSLRIEDHTQAEHIETLDNLWEKLRVKLNLPPGSFEKFAQRGGSLGEQLRSPPDIDSTPGDLIPLAETDAGRTIWAVNADGWDEDAFKGENTAFGMRPDGSIETVTLDEDEDESEREDKDGRG